MDKMEAQFQIPGRILIVLQHGALRYVRAGMEQFHFKLASYKNRVKSSRSKNKSPKLDKNPSLHNFFQISQNRAHLTGVYLL